jgi:hypothetical protein
MAITKREMSLKRLCIVNFPREFPYIDERHQEPLLHSQRMRRAIG